MQLGRNNIRIQGVSGQKMAATLLVSDVAPALACAQADGLILDIDAGGETVIGQLKGTALRLTIEATDMKFLADSFHTATSFFTLMCVPVDKLPDPECQSACPDGTGLGRRDLLLSLAAHYGDQERLRYAADSRVSHPRGGLRDRCTEYTGTHRRVGTAQTLCRPPCHVAAISLIRLHDVP
jgi:hypothetical protein